jgi:hypothetical protein
MTITRFQKQRSPWPFRLFLLAVVVGGIGAAAFYYHVYPERLPDWAARTGLGQQMQTTRVYQWRNANGEWQVSDRPPPDGVEFTVQSYRSDDNVLPLPPGLSD